MTTVPTFLVVTNPLLETVATDLSLLDHVTLWPFAASGDILAVNCNLSPTYLVVCVIPISTLSTWTVGVGVATCFVLTVIVADACTVPFSDLAVIVALPALLPVTNPLLETVAILESLLVQTIFLTVALFGEIDADNW